MDQNTSGPAFKACTLCGRSWQTRDSFIADPSLCLNGYEADFEALEEGLFYFTHTANACGSTMVLPAGKFLDLYRGRHYTERKTLSPECPRYCLDKNQQARCEALCECAFVREVVHLIRIAPRAPTPE